MPSITKINNNHSMREMPEYRSWQNMKNRCLNKNAQDFGYYQARGITICDRWRNSFMAFYEDMGPRPKGLSLDRIDNNRGYEPGNCRWATVSVQRINRRLFSNNKSGYRGVDWVKSSQRWRARIRLNGRLIEIGRYKDIEVAAWMRDQYALQLFGDNAITNFEYKEIDRA